MEVDNGTPRPRASGPITFRACAGCGDVGRLRQFVDDAGIAWHIGQDPTTGNATKCGVISFYRVQRRAPAAVPTTVGRAEP